MAKELKPWAENEYRDFKEEMEDCGCVCWTGCAPCSFCTHPGNPRNLEEDEDAWQTVFDLDEMVAAARKVVADAVEASAAWNLDAMKLEQRKRAGLHHECIWLNFTDGRPGCRCMRCGFEVPF